MSRVDAETRSTHGSAVLGVAGALLLVSGGLVLAHFLADGTGEAATISERPDAASDREVQPPPDPEALIAEPVTLRLGEQSVRTSWRDLGFALDESLLARGVTPLAASPADLEKALRALKPGLDRGPKNARMDLPERKIREEVDGLVLDVQASMGAVEAAARLGGEEVTLPGVRIPASITVSDLGIDDISHVLATFTTKFAVAEKSRNFNLKHASGKLHGYVLQPGVLFEFNEVVGARTEKEGYKIAHVILGGEMVDGQAGGTCQVSTTLHGASFFAGLEIVKSRPHSRPSTYVQMGLDATVVYPHTDLKLKNPYDFPVVISYRVGRGEATVKILGKKRPYDQIAFERDVTQRIDFDTVTREDFEMPVGYMVVDQLGFPGYKVRRYRKYYRDGKVVKTDKWKIEYRPVTEYVRTGANPDPNLPPPKNRKPHGPKPPRGKHYRMVQ